MLKQSAVCWQNVTQMCRYGLKQYQKGREGFVRLLQQLAVASKESSSAPEAAQSAASEADAEL